jgi:hypothetical protein
MAANFRSTCDSERALPECRTQAFPAGTPQVGQRTEDICFGVSLLFFILSECDYTQSRICRFVDIACSSAVLCTKAVRGPPECATDLWKNRWSHRSHRYGLTDIMARTIRSKIPLRFDRWIRLLWHCGQFSIAILLLTYRGVIVQRSNTARLSRFAH